MTPWYDLGIVYILLWIPFLIWGDKWMSWIDLSSPQKRLAFMVSLLVFTAPWSYFWAMGFPFEYTIEQFKQVGIASAIVALIKALYYTFRSPRAYE